MSGLLDFIYDLETFVDLYEILQVEMDSKFDEIKMAYIKMAKQHHPDQGGSTDKFLEITRAYEILYNKETRKEYDLYYLKKNMDEFKSDDITRLRDDFKNFVSTNTKPISKEELDKLYAETFTECKDDPMGIEELHEKVNDIHVERENTMIETSDDTLSNFISQHKDSVKINDLFEYIKYKNTQSFSNSIMIGELGTLDTINGNSCGYSSFVNENENFGSNTYSYMSEMNTAQSSQSTNDLNIDEFNQWKNTKYSDSKLTTNDIEDYLKKRREEEDNIFKEVEKNLEPISKIKETEKFLKTKHLRENINEYYNELEKPCVKREIKKSNFPEIIDISNDGAHTHTYSNSDDNQSTHTNSSDINGILKFMDEINNSKKQDFELLEKEISIDKYEKKQDDLMELKSSIEVPKSSNVRKREFK